MRKPEIQGGDPIFGFDELPAAILATHFEVLGLRAPHRPWGLGWIDVQLLASAQLSHCRFWTFDKRSAQAAAGLGLA